ncbi:GntR family transcriptional regulator [Jannaschia seohaensis]|uniref:DNA-binding GntR family transcriptional regulator n=1 Tax=Jannaschia seohaensis TaxID=475081 RepID=A0A2Y9APJ6_9RHOB|nr:GntR family transcriptional regulator [Jannaschia seohaensis]PWJ20320.1 DNA-binding GntR family transcriptional regulator [Jannaschia seohaensis]SSA44357.1 DNA-binding transcriptional regulator, GntR family [Jannaschia seohaensis]
MTAQRKERAGPAALKAHEIADVIEDDVIFGLLRPHEELPEDALIARFDAKRHVVRQAIALLIDRRVATKPFNRSARVKDVSPQEVAEIYEIRDILQRAAILRLTFPSPRELDHIEAVRQAHARACARSDRREIHRLNDAFHAAIFNHCANRSLARDVARYARMANAVRSFGIADPTLRARALRDHAEMVEALKARDRDALAELCSTHIRASLDTWLTQRAPMQPGGLRG